ncbi:MAG: hypothetical protein FWG88_06165 [Oscillospiraceae bacterium]|nr:hypothetical protein [Oscillospiraceae bacterium]
MKRKRYLLLSISFTIILAVIVLASCNKANIRTDRSNITNLKVIDKEENISYAEMLVIEIQEYEFCISELMLPESYEPDYLLYTSRSTIADNVNKTTVGYTSESLSWSFWIELNIYSSTKEAQDAWLTLLLENTEAPEVPALEVSGITVGDVAFGYVHMLYFVRSNVCVYIHSNNPNASIASIAQELDAQIITALDEAQNNHVDASYEIMLENFIQSTISYDNETSQSGYDNYTYFSELHTLLSDILRQMESIQNLDSELEQLADLQTGFSVTFSELHETNKTTFRIVELNSRYTESTMGAFDGLFLQYWTEDEVSCLLIANTTNNAASMRTIMGYSFFDEDGIVAVYMKQYNNVGKHEDTYSIIMYSIYGDEIVNISPSVEYPLDNGYWSISIQEYNFHESQEQVYALLISELGEDDNAYKTLFEVSDNRITISNEDSTESSIMLEMNNGAWQILASEASESTPIPMINDGTGVLSENIVRFAEVDSEFRALNYYSDTQLPFGEYSVSLIEGQNTTIIFTEEYLLIDGIEIPFENYNKPTSLHIVDIDINDGFREILAVEFGVNDWFVNTIYHYDGYSVCQIAQFISLIHFDGNGKIVGTDSTGANLHGRISDPLIARSYYELKDWKLEEIQLSVKGLTLTFADDYTGFCFYETEGIPSDEFAQELILNATHYPNRVTIDSDVYDSLFAGKRFTLIEMSEVEWWYRGAWYYVEIEDGRTGIIHWYYAL